MCNLCYFLTFHLAPVCPEIELTVHKVFIPHPFQFTHNTLSSCQKRNQASSEKWLIQSLNEGSCNKNLKHLVPQNKEMLKNDDRSQRQRSQFELAFTNQVWDNLSTKTVKAVMNY